MERRTLDLWVGIFVVAGFVAFLLLALKVANFGSIDNKQTYLLKAHFENIGGLQARSAVRSAGVVVGRVSDIRFDTKRYDAEVGLSIYSNYRFPKDTTASILTSGILGENYIGLDAGGDTEELNSGEEIKLTQSAVVLERLIGQFLYGKASEAEKK